ncbi:MAG: SCO family protein [Burkholderiales bacterium]|nr:SCO family protein [Nitrosomonas sp.]MCP5273515.1 SCO family protein [Burkholderiales bacterium]
MMSENESVAAAVAEKNETRTAVSQRRKLLSVFPALLATSIPALALGIQNSGVLQARTQEIMNRVENDGFPDVMVIAHTGEQFNFYQDLLKDRLVLINFMSIDSEDELPMTANMARLVNALGEQVGREVFVFSISYDHAKDTPDRLANFARRFDVTEGWYFLSAAPEDVVALGYRLYRTSGRPRQRMNADLIHYGNVRIGLWGAIPAHISDVDLAVTRVTSVFPGKPVGSEIRRAGPRRLNMDGPVYDSRDRYGMV